MVDARSGTEVSQSPAMPILLAASQTYSAPSLGTQRLIGRPAPQSWSFVARTPARKLPALMPVACSTASNNNPTTSVSFALPSRNSWGALCRFPKADELRTDQASVPGAPPLWANLAVFEESQRRAEDSSSTNAPSKPVGNTPVGTSISMEYTWLRVNLPLPGAGLVGRSAAKFARNKECTPLDGVLDVNLSAHFPLCATTTASKCMVLRCLPSGTTTAQLLPSRRMPFEGDTHTSCRTSTPLANAFTRLLHPAFPIQRSTESSAG
mmetsp:Transcript_67393/g.217614  ORF Transcript_67393/g.217614 Transcript_67393/m.217614 type:complete len:266 (-) Transcript_67393:263-1060(-)